MRDQNASQVISREFPLLNINFSLTGSFRLVTTGKHMLYRVHRPLVQELQANILGCFAGVSRSTANDLLYLLCLFPGFSSFLLCSNDDLFMRLEEGIHKYLLYFTTRAYLDMASSVPNSDNPFAFNEHANTFFISHCVKVYRTPQVRMPRELYNQYVSSGLLNEYETINDSHGTGTL